MATTTRNQAFTREITERLDALVWSQPEVLLEHDGGPEWMRADAYVARLRGFDDEVVAGWRLDSALPYLLMPIPSRASASAYSADVNIADITIRTARYELQSGYARMRVSSELAHLLEIESRFSDLTAEVLFLRYKRRS